MSTEIFLPCTGTRGFLKVEPACVVDSVEIDSETRRVRSATR